MKKIFSFVIIGLHCTALSFAQSDDNLSDFSVRKNEIGIRSVQLEAHESGIYSSIGLNYKRWLKPNLGLRFEAGYEGYINYNPPAILEVINNDSIRMGYFHQETNGIQLSIGIEYQKEILENFYLYTAFDLSGGYGKGKAESYNDIESIENISLAKRVGEVKNDYGALPYSVAYLNLRPAIGAKYVIKRFSWGFDISPSHFQFSSKTVHQTPQKNQLLSYDFTSFSSIKGFVNFRF